MTLWYSSFFPLFCNFFFFKRVISTICTCILSWSQLLQTEQTFLHTFHRRRLQIYYRHSNAFSYRIKKHTSCAIHTHSGKSYNPVSCERAQVAGLIGPGSGLILRDDVLTDMYGKKNVGKRKKKEQQAFLRIYASPPQSTFDTIQGRPNPRDV